MKHRRVYKLVGGSVRAAIAAALEVGAFDEDVFVITSPDVVLEDIPSDRIDATTDMVPAAVRGVIGGAVTGFLVGLAALAIPSIGMTMAGAGALAAAGAVVGTFMASLAGSSVPNSVRRRFAREIDQGALLLVVDIAKRRSQALDVAMQRVEATALPFDSLSIVS